MSEFKKSMSRKRFVKKIMGLGLQRNQAKAVAHDVMETCRRTSYSDLWSSPTTHMILTTIIMSDALAAGGRAARKMRKAFDGVMAAIRASVIEVARARID